MNYTLSYKIEEVYKAKGYNVELQCSNSSDYVKITNPADKYGFKFVVRLSDHDAMTGRSACADMQIIACEMWRGTWEGMFESMYGLDECGDADDCGDYAYPTEEERDQAIEAVVLAKLNEKIDF